ncbi:MAG: HAMP domain-containing histidine kinase [Planctomycetaceae bacterium]|nr:HAMP domain-containing histidine kinase [Planctomycetaceae bacterium]
MWQFTEHRQQCELIHKTLSSQAEALSNAVIGSLRSHRWFGPFVQQQLPFTLEVLTRADNVLAVAVVVNGDVQHPYFAGNVTQVDLTLADGEHVSGDTLQLVRSFEKENRPPLYADVLPEEENRPPVENFKAIVVLDRSTMTAQISAEQVNRILIVVFGTLLLAAAGVGWRFTVQLAKAEGQTRLLKAESRHLHELGQAAAGLAHETRNPLGLIRGWTQRLVEAGLPRNDQQEQAEAILEECDRVTARINQFLSFARPADVHPEPVEFRELLDELQTLLQSDLEERKLTLVAGGLQTEQKILADRNLLRQMLFNLLQNAIAFAPEGSTITITLNQSRSGQVRLEVTDEGPGVPQEIVDSLFEPYVTRRPGGTGLGLSIVRRIASAHEWEAGYEPGRRRGSTFWVDRIRNA